MTDPVRDAIVARLNTIADIGMVHDYQRYSQREQGLKDLYVYNGQLRGWFVRRLSVLEKTINTRANMQQKKWLIRGYMAIDDTNASELVFDGLIDAIQDAFRLEWLGRDLDSSLTLAKADEPAGVTLEDSGPVLFAGVLCHSAKCVLITREIKNYPNRI